MHKLMSGAQGDWGSAGGDGRRRDWGKMGAALGEMAGGRTGGVEGDGGGAGGDGRRWDWGEMAGGAGGRWPVAGLGGDGGSAAERWRRDSGEPGRWRRRWGEMGAAARRQGAAVRGGAGGGRPTAALDPWGRWGTGVGGRLGDREMR
uniref:Uncharacterized protein n=1 Tax=Setaria italica TaxID=4555 RepID=A0A0Q3V2E3_SETIT